MGFRNFRKPSLQLFQKWNLSSSQKKMFSERRDQLDTNWFWKYICSRTKLPAYDKDGDFRNKKLFDTKYCPGRSRIEISAFGFTFVRREHRRPSITRAEREGQLGTSDRIRHPQRDWASRISYWEILFISCQKVIKNGNIEPESVNNKATIAFSCTKFNLKSSKISFSFCSNFTTHSFSILILFKTRWSRLKESSKLVKSSLKFFIARTRLSRLYDSFTLLNITSVGVFEILSVSPLISLTRLEHFQFQFSLFLVGAVPPIITSDFRIGSWMVTFTSRIRVRW